MGSIGYARASTLEQDADLDHEAMPAQGQVGFSLGHGVKVGQRDVLPSTTFCPLHKPQLQEGWQDTCLFTSEASSRKVRQQP